MDKEIYGKFISTGEKIIAIHDDWEKIITELESGIAELKKVENAGQEHEEGVKIFEERLFKLRILQNESYGRGMSAYSEMQELINDVSFEIGYWEALKK